MIEKELIDLMLSIKHELIAIRTDLTLINHDVIKINERIDTLTTLAMQPQESIGIAPNTPHPSYLPPEVM